MTVGKTIYEWEWVAATMERKAEVEGLVDIEM